jgi:hypothetical protein
VLPTATIARRIGTAASNHRIRRHDTQSISMPLGVERRPILGGLINEYAQAA